MGVAALLIDDWIRGVRSYRAEAFEELAYLVVLFSINRLHRVSGVGQLRILHEVFIVQTDPVPKSPVTDRDGEGSYGLTHRPPIRLQWGFTVPESREK